MLSDWFKLGDETFDVNIISLEETTNTLCTANTGRTLGQGARMVLDPIGTFIGHSVTIKNNKSSLSDYDRLYDFLIKPRYDGVNVKIVHNQTTIEYEAYFSITSRKLKRIDDVTKKVYWDEISFDIIPMEAQVLP